LRVEEGVLVEPEKLAREVIDKQLENTGWIIQNYKELNLGAGIGIAIREFPLKTGYADYLLIIDRKAIGVVEAKKAGYTLSGVEDQSERYRDAIDEYLRYSEIPPFAYETTGFETYFRDMRDPEPRSRTVFNFHRPEELKRLLEEENSLRERLKNLPPLNIEGLRECQVRAIKNLEVSFSESRPRALIQMATGSGKTYTAVSFIYRLIKFAKAKRILFLVDRKNLGRQALREFEQYVTPDDGRKLSELYNIQLLTTNVIDKICKVTITTVQRLYSMLKGEEAVEEDLEEQSLFNFSVGEKEQYQIEYNPKIPIETFDFIVVDECHRSIYNLWRQVIEYFDSFIIGLTATPAKHTYAFFNKNLVMEYSHEEAVADNVNVGYEVYQILTKITKSGSKIDAGYYVTKRDKLTREKRWDLLDEDVEYDPNELDRRVVSKDQIRTIISTFKEKLFTDIFPGREEVPKTVIFAKDDSHAEDIVHIVRQVFGKGNDFCKKITYRSSAKTEDLIKEFRNSYNPRIAVSVDMISTGTDIRPLECLLFMRAVKSRVYYEQMKGRGTRTVDPNDLKAVTPDANYKTHFVIVDAIGVTLEDKTDTQPLERKRTVAFDKLMQQIALGQREDDNISSLASRLAILNNKLDTEDRRRIEQITGKPVKRLIHNLLDSINIDKNREKAKEKYEIEIPTKEQIELTKKEMIDESCSPFDNPDLRNLLIELKEKREQIIDDISIDEVLETGFTTDQAKNLVTTFQEILKEKRDELTALQIIYEKPFGQRHLTYKQIKDLAETIKSPPYYLTTERLWGAYRKLDVAKVKGARPERLLTNIIALVRFALNETMILEPFEDTVDKKFQEWLTDQQIIVEGFTHEQIEWLEMIKEHIKTSVSIEREDFQEVPFNLKGGIFKAHELFGDKLNRVIVQLNEVLAG